MLAFVNQTRPGEQHMHRNCKRKSAQSFNSSSTSKNTVKTAYQIDSDGAPAPQVRERERETDRQTDR